MISYKNQAEDNLDEPKFSISPNLNNDLDDALSGKRKEGKQGILWDRLLLVTNQTDNNNNNIIVIQKIQSSANIENKSVKANKIVTVYGKDTLQEQIKEAELDNRILYLNKNKSQTNDDTIKSLSLDEHNTIDFDNNIKQFWENFNYLRNKKSINKDLSNSLEESKGHLFDGIDTSNLLKHSLKVKTESDTDLKSLQKENSYLKRKVESLKEEFKLTKGYEPNQADVSRIANKLKVDLSSTYDRQVLKDNLTQIFEYINKYNGENTAEVMQVSANLAKDLLQQSGDFERSISPELKEVRQAIKSYDFKLSSVDLADLQVVGGYNNIRKHYIRKISLSKTKGIGIDIAYQELSNRHPWLFDVEINNTSDQLLKIPQTFGQVAITMGLVSRTVYVDKDSWISEQIQIFYQKHPQQNSETNC